MTNVLLNHKPNNDEGPAHRSNATGAIVAILLFTMLVVEIACLVAIARLIDDQLTARMLSAYVALGGLVVFAVLVQRGLARSNPKPTFARKLLYAAYLLAGVAVIALINGGPYHSFFSAAKPLAAGS